MKGIILAGGAGTRLHPVTLGINKQMLPIYDKPMIYYPLTTLMLIGIRDILIISTTKDLPSFMNLLGDGKKWGINLTYAEQPNPDGLAQAFIIGEKFIDKDNVCLILGDNIFYGHGFIRIVKNAVDRIGKNIGGAIFGYSVKDPQRYGVAVFDKTKKLIDIQEKPAQPKSNCAITGLYLYDNQVIKIAKSLVPSARGELEITCINRAYLQQKQLELVKLHRGLAWMDTGTHQSLLDASQYFCIIEERQGVKAACPEEVAWRMGYISSTSLHALAMPLSNNGYGRYLLRLVSEEQGE